MKRIVSFALILMLLFSFAACNTAQKPNDKPTAAPTEQAETPTQAPTEAPEEPTAEPTVEPTPVPTAMPEYDDGSSDDLPEVYAGNDVFFIAYPEGALYGWGNNAHGQVGNGKTENAALPVFVGTDLTPVIVGDTVFAIGSDKTLYGWGRNDAYQLGLGDTDDRLTPTAILERVTDVKAFAGSYFALTDNGDLYRWGVSSRGYNFSEEQMEELKAPELVRTGVLRYYTNHLITNTHELYACYDGFEWIKACDDAAEFWSDYSARAVQGTDGKLYAFNYSNERSLICDSFRDVIVCDGVIWVLMNDGSLYSYAVSDSNIYGSREEERNKLTFVMNEVVCFKADSMIDEDWGYDYKFALKANGELWSWGAYNEPMLGKTRMANSDEPACVAYDVSRFWCTGHATYIVQNDGMIWASGLASESYLVHGSLGDGTTATRYGFVPVTVDSDGYGFYNASTINCHMDLEYFVDDNDDTDWCEIFSRTFAVDRSGNVYAWGWNGDGLLGVGSADEEVLLPTQIHNAR